MYRAVTHDIEVSVEPFFLPDHSEPEENRYVWAYQVTIANHSRESVKVLARYWHITDAMGRVQEVRGEGVVGEQPEIEPGNSFRYTSGCPLSTSSGIMVGHYTMETDDGEMLEVDIPAFSLDFPGDEVSVN
ncbi:Co2+/Mg2+ efflux protein ApaG [Chelativorans sp. AA-79]|uniref:Co2+/Mg2+ efflux protein ApaG n=1 Tax=Chelativorans sp. AA-79 TaxID=3028735 RepID=UPI0023F6A575|nr:Co2+/Mg2+ efflux protein ApaG [Chelativorans sp. AA-79]WEX09073.1 Co2+/Mg2+ efflux protein ApaG [Chelativorans sp. AA-79]